MRSTGTDQPVRVMKAGHAAGAKGLGQRLSLTSNWQQEETLAATKPFDIPKLWVAKAFQVVKAAERRGWTE